jgi:YVTN family beta-propeller protein
VRVKSISGALRFAAPVALAAGLVCSVGAPAWAAGSGYSYSLAATISPPSDTNVFYAADDPATQTVYVADGDNEVLVISESTDTVTGTIPVNGGPDTVAVDPVTDTIYVTTFSSGVAVINGATDTVTATIPLGPAIGLVVDQATDTLYAVGEGTGTIAVIDGSTNTVTDTLTGFEDPVGIAVDPGTGYLYIADRDTDVVTVINVATDTVAATIDTSAAPLEIAVDPVTQLVYVTGADGTLWVISEGTLTVTATYSVGVVPAAVAVDTSTDAVYVGDSNTDELYVIDGSTGAQRAAVSLNSSVSDSPGGLVADSVSHTAFAISLEDNFIYVITQGTAAAVAIDTGNNQSATAGQQFATPLSVTVTDANGNPVDDATVTFSIAAGTGGTANFGGTAQTATATTDSSGVATAPTLYAGTAAGPVMVTATSGTGQTTFVETVTSAGPARADLAIQIGAPATLTHGTSGTITVTVTNNGPQAAAHVLTALSVPNGLTVTNAGGGTLRGGVDFFTAPTLASGQKLTYTVTVKAGNAKKTVLLLAVTASATRDPNLLNNIRTATLKIT